MSSKSLKDDKNASTEIKLTQIHLSCKSQYETQEDGAPRMDKELFTNMNQIEKQGDTKKMPYYACESKIQLSFDDLFGD